MMFDAITFGIAGTLLVFFAIFGAAVGIGKRSHEQDVKNLKK